MQHKDKIKQDQRKERKTMAKLDALDSHLSQTAYDEMEGRMLTITRQIAARMEDRDLYRVNADKADAAITQLSRLRDEYQAIFKQMWPAR